MLLRKRKKNITEWWEINSRVSRLVDLHHQWLCLVLDNVSDYFLSMSTRQFDLSSKINLKQATNPWGKRKYQRQKKKEKAQEEEEEEERTRVGVAEGGGGRIIIQNTTQPGVVSKINTLPLRRRQPKYTRLKGKQPPASSTISSQSQKECVSCILSDDRYHPPLNPQNRHTPKRHGIKGRFFIENKKIKIKILFKKHAFISKRTIKQKIILYIYIYFQDIHK